MTFPPQGGRWRGEAVTDEGVQGYRLFPSIRYRVPDHLPLIRPLAGAPSPLWGEG